MSLNLSSSPSQKVDSASSEWVERTDPATGKPYYVNRVTKETRWIKPGTPEPASKGNPQAASPASPWVEKLDPATGNVFYFNKETKETRWTRPFPEALPAAAAGNPHPGSAAREQPNGGEALDPAWVERTDPASGKTYYYHKGTKETRWTKPTVAASAAAAATTPAAAPPVAAVANAPTASSSSADVWMERVDPKTGKTYYYNRETKETSWVRPNASLAAAAPVPSSPQPPPTLAQASDDDAAEWVERSDSKTNKVYYYHKRTRETRWDKPQGMLRPTAAPPASALAGPSAAGTPQPSAASNTASAPATATAPPASPPPASPASQPNTAVSKWIERRDPATGNLYYYHEDTRETSWTKPDEGGIGVRPLTSPATAEAAAQPSGPGRSRGQSIASSPSKRSDPSSPFDKPGSNWTRRVDYKSGQFLYYNIVTGETQWNDPFEPTVELILPVSTDVIFCFGGNERPPLKVLSEIPPHQTFSSVECLEGQQWVTLQNGFHDPRRAQNPQNPRRLDVPPLPFDFEDVHAVKIGPAECILFGRRVSDGAPSCFQWNSETLAVTPRFDLQGLVSHGTAFCSVPMGVVATGGYLDETMQRVAADAIVMNTATSSPYMLPKMRFARANHAMAVIDLSNSQRLLWFAFVFGGFDGQRKCNTVERYVLGGPSWEVMNEMPLCRSGHCAVAVDRTIYVLGGRSGYRVLADMDFVHVQSDTWSTAKPMHHARVNFGAAYVSSYLVVVGGFDGTRYLNSVEAYDPRIDVWRFVRSLSVPKQLFGMVVMRRATAKGQTEVSGVALA